MGVVVKLVRKLVGKLEVELRRKLIVVEDNLKEEHLMELVGMHRFAFFIISFLINNYIYDN